MFVILVFHWKKPSHNARAFSCIKDTERTHYDLYINMKIYFLLCPTWKIVYCQSLLVKKCGYAQESYDTETQGDGIAL